MKIKHNAEVPLNGDHHGGAAGCKVRWLVGEADAALKLRDAAVRARTRGPHATAFHPYEHEISSSKAKGSSSTATKSVPYGREASSSSPDGVHQFRNVGHTPFQDALPHPQLRGRQEVTVVPECGIESRLLLRWEMLINHENTRKRRRIA